MSKDKYKETFETWNKVASLYQEKFMDLDLYNDTYDFLCTHIPKENSKLLEIGCGPGNITKYLLSKRPDFEIFGIDIAENMIGLAKSNNPNAKFAIMDCREIDKIKTSFDGIICGFCLPYLSQSDSQKLIADLSKLLNENGILYLSFIEGDPSSSGYQTNSLGDRVYFYFYERSSLLGHLSENKLDILNTFKLEYKKSDSETEIHMIVIAKNDV
ncbi:MAG: class I SAM-dependent methyltransferase [Saprospiraceae bacterium]|nr:class I SAM-dependent methyltransferase [Saprospiraceae bacterium]